MIGSWELTNYEVINNGELIVVDVGEQYNWVITFYADGTYTNIGIWGGDLSNTEGTFYTINENLYLINGNEYICEETQINFSILENGLTVISEGCSILTTQKYIKL